MKAMRPLFLFVALLLVVGMACNALSTGGNDTPEPVQQQDPTTPPQQQEETEAPEPEPTEAPATEEPAPVQSEFYTEEFDNPLSSDWTIFYLEASDKADVDKVTVEAEEGKLVWDFDSEYLYYYLFNTAHSYEDVTVQVNADNLGRNNNNVSLMCRYDPEVGWYEFNIANNGLYNIFFAEINSQGKIVYNRITNGGSNAIKQGKDVNEYSITCKGEELSLYINGDEVNTITERKYSLRDGNIGVSVSSFNVLPIRVEMDWVKVTEP